LKLFLCGDVMTGRGVDQILPNPSPPEICEPYIKDAREYVKLAEEINGRVPRGVSPSYIWGDALEELERAQPDARIVNLETSITVSEELCPKGINYRMHPANVGCLSAASVDVCVLANNHILDYGVRGLIETVATLERAGIACCGAGANLVEALRPAILDVGGPRVIVFAFGTASSGVPPAWSASELRPGVAFLPKLSDDTAQEIAARVVAIKRPDDVVVASIHWGSNWGYELSPAQVRFARRLIDSGVDVVHGHSSHHPRPIEIYRDKLILYGCGDFIDDYEGISGYEEYRDDLVQMYFPVIDSDTGRLIELRMTPMQLRKLSLHRASPEDAHWLRTLLDRMSAPRGAPVVLDGSRLRVVTPAGASG